MIGLMSKVINFSISTKPSFLPTNHLWKVTLEMLEERVQEALCTKWNTIKTTLKQNMGWHTVIYIELV